jgi:hypothetical protein
LKVKKHENIESSDLSFDVGNCWWT